MIREDDFGNMSEAQVAILRRIRREHFGEALTERELEHLTELSCAAFDASPETATTPEQREAWLLNAIDERVDHVMEDIRLGRPTLDHLNLPIREFLEKQLGQEEGSGMKTYILAIIVAGLPLLAGCQQRTSFDARVEYYEKKVAPRERYDPEQVWQICGR